jgi:hypothetical protein
MSFTSVEAWPLHTSSRWLPSPGALSAALLTCALSEVLLGIPIVRCPASCCDQVGYHSLCRGTRGTGGLQQLVVVLMVGAKTWAFLGVGVDASVKALHSSLVLTTATLVSAFPLPEGVVMKFPPLISGGSHVH